MNTLFRLTFTFVFTCFTVLQACSQEDTLYKKKEFINNSGDTLLYRMLEPGPDCLKKYPLVIFLHGAGERGNDNEKQLVHGTKLFSGKQNMIDFPCFVIAPQCPENKRWVEVSWSLPKHDMPVMISEPLGLTMELINQMILKYPIDTNRIYITGLSMGGFGTWDLISRYPEKFAAAIPICGGGDEKQAKNMVDIPIRAFHGTKDKVVQVARSRNMINAIKKEGGNPLYTEYPTLGHLCWNKAYSEPGLLKWMFSQTKEKAEDK